MPGHRNGSIVISSAYVQYGLRMCSTVKYLTHAGMKSHTCLARNEIHTGMSFIPPDIM